MSRPSIVRRTNPIHYMAQSRLLRSETTTPTTQKVGHASIEENV
jgi:hypothetical protein